MENENALKHRFGKDLLDRIANSIRSVYPAFPDKKFTGLYPRLKNLEMKERVRLLRSELAKLLPPEYAKALKIIMKSMEAGPLEGFDLWVYTEFIQTYGLAHHKISLIALRKLTTRFSSEWAVRPFLKSAPAETLAFLLACAKHKNERVRRWASEGTRPRLPWGERLHEFIAEPALTSPILEQLKFDPDLFVRTSVANHLNDLAKDHPDRVIALLHRWKSEAGQTHAAKVEWMIKRGLRSLIKAGNPKALELVGVEAITKIEIKGFKLLPKKVSLGGRLHFSLQLASSSEKTQKIVIDYILHFMKANGETSPKVFKLKVLLLHEGETVTIERSHQIKPITTRRYYPGKNELEIQINGQPQGRLTWFLNSLHE